MVLSSGHRKFWNELLPHLFQKKRALIKNCFQGQRIGVNIVELLSADHKNHKDIVKSLFQQRPVFRPRNAMESIQKLHTALTEYAEVDPIYVFPGALVPSLPEHANVHEGRQNRLGYLSLFRQRCDAGLVHDNSERLTAMKYARILNHFPNRTLHVLAQWMQTEQNMSVMRAPFEVSWQLAHMERDGITTATLSSDPGIAIMGSTNQLVETTFGIKKKKIGPKCFRYLGEPDLFGREHYRFNLLPYRDYLPEVAALIGGRSSYAPRLPFSSVKTIVTTTVPQYLAAKEQRSGNGEFVFWNRLKGGTAEYRQAVERAVHLFRYCPVLRQPSESSSSSGLVSTTSNMQLVPLNPLPEGTDLKHWKDWIGFDPVTTLPISPANYHKAARFEDGYSFGGDTYLDEWCRGPTPSNFRNDDVELQYG